MNEWVMLWDSSMGLVYNLYKSMLPSWLVMQNSVKFFKLKVFHIRVNYKCNVKIYWNSKFHHHGVGFEQLGDPAPMLGTGGYCDVYAILL